jgi:hypothetical protein
MKSSLSRGSRDMLKTVCPSQLEKETNLIAIALIVIALCFALSNLCSVSIRAEVFL